MSFMQVVGVAAQHASMGDPVYPEKLHADLEVMREAIQQAHPDPYRYFARGDLDSMFHRVADSIIRPLTADAFAARLMPLLQRIGDSNLYIDLDRELLSRIEAAATVLPLRVRLLEEGMYIQEELKGFRTFPVGSRVISVNGLDSERIMRDCGQWIICDGRNETRRLRMIEEDLSGLFLLTYGSSPSYLVEAEGPDGARIEAVLTGMRREDIEHSRKPVGAGLLPWRSTWEPGTSTMWLRLTTLEPDALEQGGQRPKQFLASLLKEMEKSHATNLVLDLRGCGGRELALAEQVFSAIAMESFRLIQGMTAHPGQLEMLDGMVDLPDDHVASLDRNYLPVSNGVVALRPDDPRLEAQQPMPRAFSGRVYVVCDGATRDAAAALVMLVKRSGRGRILGEETGTNAMAFTGGNEALITLPNSGITLHIPLIRYVPDGSATGPTDRGELPHYYVQQQPWGVAKGRDTVRLAVLEMIKALQ